VDPVNDEIYVGTSLDQILVFPREANGDVAPIRILGGPDTKFGGRPAIRVDAVRDVLLVTGDGGMLIFDRTASGNAKPKAVIPGASGNQFDIYNGMVLTHEVDHIYAWSIDKPDARPLMKILAPLGARAETTGQRGVAVDPVHKEVIIGTAAGNQVMTFSVPELFAERVESSQR
jgi:hypothetical protein